MYDPVADFASLVADLPEAFASLPVEGDVLAGDGGTFACHTRASFPEGTLDVYEGGPGYLALLRGRLPGYADADVDGWAACEDCDDADAGRSPGLIEVCDAADVDEDCDGGADDGDSGPVGVLAWYADADGDGYGDAGGRVDACDAPAGHVSDQTDCDDTDAGISPAGTEVCDAADADEDCDGAADDADTSVTGTTEWHPDADGDSYGSASSTQSTCDQPAGWTTDTQDCDDTTAARSPALTEACDAADLDEDCDGVSDDADGSVTGESAWYADTDGDGYGAGSAVMACSSPSGYVAASTDCDDTNAARSPALTEVCDAANLDEDCDGLADDADPGVTATTAWHPDADGDGYGSSASTTHACVAPSGYVASATDCDDASAAHNPAATEVCDTADVDEDCDGLADDADPTVTGGTVYYVDADGDGYGTSTTTSRYCSPPASRYSAVSTDCDDGSASTNPSGSEACDAANADEDCDGLADDADSSATGKTTWYVDGDGDGYGDAGATVSACDQGSYADNDDDCDESDAGVNPGESEVCVDGVDQDCDGAVDDRCASGSWTGDYDADETLGDADVLLWGGMSGSEFGTSIVAGYSFTPYALDTDFAVSAPQQVTRHGTSPTISYYGAVYVYDYVRDGSFVADAEAEGYYYGSSSTSYDWGYEIYGIEDLDEDGIDEIGVVYDGTDLYLLEPEYAATSGTQGPRGTYFETGTWTSATSGGSFYTYVPAVWVAANANYGGTTGRVYIYLGSGSSAALMITGAGSSPHAGCSVAGGEDKDFDGDGYDDLVIGAEGSAYVVLGNNYSGAISVTDADLTLTGTSYFGKSVLSPGDVDNDGYDDIAVGATTTSEGAVYLFTNVNPSGSSPDAAAGDARATFTGDNAADYIGADGRYQFGDVDGNGDVDVLISSPFWDGSSASDGAAWLIYGGATGFLGDYDLGVDYHARFVGGAGDECGYSSALGDLDGDRSADILIGCQSGTVGSYSAYGSVAIFYGQ